MFAAGKLDDAIKELKRMKIDLLGISELRWPYSGTCKRDDGVLYIIPIITQGKHHRNVVGILLSPEMNKYVTNFIPLSIRIILIIGTGSR